MKLMKRREELHDEVGIDQDARYTPNQLKFGVFLLRT